MNPGPDFIPGIHNYCDRWCERCPLTARCRSFALEQAIRRRSDDENADFWAAFDDGLLPERDLDARLVEPLAPDEDWFGCLASEGQEDAFDRAAHNPLSLAATDHAHQLRHWLARQGLRDAPRRTTGLDATARDDALEILEWYSLQIGVKLTRAMSGQLALDEDAASAADDEDDGWEADDGPRDEGTSQALRDAERTDRDGSAKVALIGIERSLGALTMLRREFPTEDATIRKLFRRLSQLRVEIDRRWPNARTFQRPGLDD